MSISFTAAGGQVNDVVDSLANEVCNSYNKIKAKLDSAQARDIFLEHIGKYTSKMNTETAKIAVERVSYRLQTQCAKLIDYLKKFSGPNWISVHECPKSILSDKDLDYFFTIQSFWYIEQSGDTTNVEITETEWIDYMKDGTYSKLSLKRTSPCDFFISFIESNNIVKSSMSKVGDRYNYTIISKESNFYTLCVSLPDVKRATIFKLYHR